MIDKKPGIRDICCYLSGEVDCTKNDCLLVGIAGLMLGALITGFFTIL